MRISDWSSDGCSSDLDVLLPVGNADVALRVDLADVAGVQPAVDDRARRRLRIVPVALHDQLAAYQDFAILGDAHLNAGKWPSDRAQLVAAGWVAAPHGRRFGLAVALQDAPAGRGRPSAVQGKSVSK